MTFDAWWSAYDPDDVNSPADKAFARYVWDCARVAELEAALEAALCGLPQELPPASWDSWARAHRAARAALAKSRAAWTALARSEARP